MMMHLYGALATGGKPYFWSISYAYFWSSLYLNLRFDQIFCAYFWATLFLNPVSDQSSMPRCLRNVSKESLPSTMHHCLYNESSQSLQIGRELLQ